MGGFAAADAVVHAARGEGAALGDFEVEVLEAGWGEGWGVVA
jgi:hypothetical protein